MGNHDGLEHIDVYGMPVAALHVDRVTGLSSNEDDFFTYYDLDDNHTKHIRPVAEWKFAPSITFSFRIILNEGDNVVVEKYMDLPERLATKLADYQRRNAEWAEQPDVKRRILKEISEQVSDFIEDARGEAEAIRRRHQHTFRTAKESVPECVHLPLSNDNARKQIGRR